MARGRIRRHPDVRNLELYHEFAYEHRQQIDLAARYGLSQPRVAQICRQVRAWVDFSLAKSAPHSAAASANSGLRLHLAVMVRRKQLADAYGPFLDLFGGPAAVTTWQHLQIAADAGLLPPECFPQLPPRDSVAAALGMIRQLDHLTRVAERGPFAKLDRLSTPGDRSRPERVAVEPVAAEEPAMNQPAGV